MLRRRPTRGVPLVGLALLVPLVTGCAASTQSWRAGPAGIPVERELRRKLSDGEFEAAHAALKDRKVAPADLLLRHMYRGLVAMHAGDYDASTKAMDRAWQVAWERWTKRVSDGAVALVTGDGARPYDPGPAEQMLIPYYGAVAWLARNERWSAAVEARRLSSLLESDRGPQPPDAFRGVMRYVAGVMYEVAGERNDADVSFRNALALLGPVLPGDTIAPDPSHGDVVVLLEDGFVIRPEPRSIVFWLNDDELGVLNGPSIDERRRMVTVMRGRSGMQNDWAGLGFRPVWLNWPAMEPERHVRATARLGARAWTDAPAAVEDADAPLAFTVGVDPDPVWIEARTIAASVSDAVLADFERDQPGRLARAIARAAVREATLKGAGDAFENAAEQAKKKDDDEKKGGTLGNILLGIGLLAAHASSAVLDQPDLRGWQLLPDRLTVARMRLPVGEHVIEVTRDGEAVSLGTVTVRPASVTVLAHRFFGPGTGSVVVATP